MLFLRSLIYTGLMFLSVVPFAVPAMFSGLVPYRFRWRYAHNWSRFNFWMLRIICGLDYRIEGKENIPDRPCVVYWKHESAWETLAQTMVFPEQAWVLKRELLWVPVFGWGLAALRPIAIDRKSGRSAVMQVVRQGKRRLASGTWVMIFPEGTRVPVGTEKRFGVSGALLAEGAHVPILPVVHNAGEYWPRRGLLKKPGTITVRIGPPIDSAGKDAVTLNAEAKAWIDRERRRLPRRGD